MNKVIKISGMHCQGCVGLIRMELADGGLEEKIKDVRLVGDMLGEVELQNASAEELAQAEKIINKIEGYHTI
ncbi:MAG TPA: heavy metal-associated domain-containing protein [Candidatus Dojkabacteria bacterium]|nr:heavy metal-associated domain-containing protein [Candidatus Dojkabacteria bacterium]